MNLSHLQYFVKLAELEHYAHAAKELYITQPSLTHAIKTLEAELGVSLFEREGRKVKLTRFGHEFKEYVNRGLNEIQKGVDLAREYNQSLSGTINIGAIFTVQGDYLPYLIKEYRAIYGDGIKFNLFQGFSMPLVKGLEEGEYDLVFSAKVLGKPDICFDHMVSHELVVGVAKTSDLAQQESLSLEDLKGRVVYTYRRGTPIGEEVNDVLEESGLEAIQEYEDEITLGGMVLADDATCGLMCLSIGLKSFADLAVIPLRDVPGDFHRIYLGYKRNEFRSRSVETFLEFAHDFEPPANVVPSTHFHKS